VALSRQLKDAEAKLVELQNVGTFPFLSPVLAPTYIMSYNESLWYNDSFSNTAFFSRAH
jgi:hypothetical protein